MLNHSEQLTVERTIDKLNLFSSNGWLLDPFSARELAKELKEMVNESEKISNEENHR